MTSKLPWTTAAILIVAAVAVGTWAIFGGAPAEVPPPVTEGEWNVITGGTLPQALAWPATGNSGIVKFYIMEHGEYTSTENLYDDTEGQQGENAMGSATATSFDISITYDTLFDIVIAVQGHKDNMGQTTTAFLQMDLVASAQSTDWSIDSEEDPENSTNDMEHEFGSPPANYYWANVVWDNDGNGYQLKADDNLLITKLRLVLRG